MKPRTKPIKVKAGVMYSWDTSRRFRPIRSLRLPVCPLCLMRAWSSAARLCEFCGTTAESLARAGIKR